MHIESGTIQVEFGGDSMATINRRPPLDRGKRGAVVHWCPQFDGNPGPNTIGWNIAGRHVMETHNLYPALLLFDFLEFPPNTNLAPTDAGISYLLQEGIAAPVDLSWLGKGNNPTLRRQSYDTYRAREIGDPGAWSIWHLTGDDPIPKEDAAPGLAFRLQLQDALILPDPNLPVEDILSFRDRRSDELFALRAHVDDLCHEIAQGGYGGAHVRSALEKFDRTFADYVRVSLEPNWRKWVGSLGVEMNWTAAAAPAVSAIPIAGSLVEWAIAAVGGGLMSSLAVTSVRGAKHAGSDTPFAYMTDVYREYGKPEV